MNKNELLRKEKNRFLPFCLFFQSFRILLKIQVYGVLRILYSIQNEAAWSTRQQSQQNSGSLYLVSKIFLSSFYFFLLFFFVAFLPSLSLLNHRL
jgi:hypothetical protein